MPVDRRPADGRTGDLPASVVEDVLDSPRRREVLRVLAKRGEPLALADVAAIVGANTDEAGVTGETWMEIVEGAGGGDADGGLTPSEARAIRDDIFQRHLPKLTATGVVEYDSMRGTLALATPEVAERAARDPSA